ncbi:MAG: hypothetical protein AAF358_20945 [Pseudomonadota bacterium]
MMEMQWDSTEGFQETPDAREAATIAELELGLRTAADDVPVYQEDDRFVRQWMAERLSSGL